MKDQKNYHKIWYEKNRKQRRQQIKQRRKRIVEWFNSYKLTLKCENCPESHVATLDFHHKNPRKKEIEIASAVRNGWSKESILKEISKCKILCSNCHRKSHWK